MDAAYLRAAVPDPFRILATDLLPFSLGHEIALQRFKNKFSIEKNEAPGMDDLLTGVFICSQPYSPKISINNFKVPFRVRILAKLLGHQYILKAFEEFGRYIKAHTETPDFYSKDDEAREPCGAPTVQAVKVSLMANLGMSESEALNMPFNLAFWNHLTHLEAHGAIQIIDDAEIQRQKESDALYLKMESKLKAIGEKMRQDFLTQQGKAAA